MNLYEETNSFIANHRAEDFKNLLARTDFQQAEDESVDDYFLYALELCVYHQTSRCARELYNHWQELYSIEEVNIPYFVYLLSLQKTKSPILAFLYKYVIPYFTYEEVLDVTIEMYIDDRADRIISRSEEIFGRQSLYFYREMYQRSVEETSNEYVANILSNILKDLEIYAEYPTWVFESSEEISPPTDVSVDFDLEDLKSTAKLLYRFSPDESISEEEILKSLQNLPEENVEMYVQKQITNLLAIDLVNREDFFHFYGPAHPMIEPEHPEERKYGGSRMFLSLEYEFNHEPFEKVRERYTLSPEQNWFTGSCSWCHRKIRRYQHALRKPIDDGGWIGCYCSSECIVESIIESNTDSYYQVKLWSQIYDDLQKYGILDIVETRTEIESIPEPPESVSFYQAEQEQTLSKDSVILLDNYDMIAELIAEYSNYLIFICYIDVDTSERVAEKYLEAFEEIKKDNSNVLFGLCSLDVATDIDDVAPPELNVYYQQEQAGQKFDFGDEDQTILEFAYEILFQYS